MDVSSFMDLKSALQMAESTMPPQLAILNSQLKEVFGEKYASIFMNVKPSQFLFNGIPLCVNPSGIAGIICSVIKSQKPQAIHEVSDGSLKFSVFGHVSIRQSYYRCENFNVEQKKY